MKNKTLYILWALLFVLCAVLGFFRETVVAGKWLMTVLSVVFFLPPAVLLWRSKKTGDSHTRLLIRDLSGASLGITLALLVVNFLSVLSSGWVGTALNALLTILSTPMIASGYWALSLFLWAFLFIASCKK